MEQPLFIPKNKRLGGKLTVFCYHCRTNVADICKGTGKSLQTCPNGARHAFKCYVHVPGTKNTRKTLTLTTRDVNEAIKQTLDFENNVKNPDLFKPEPVKSVPKQISNEKPKPELLIDALGKYVGFLNNENVGAHRVKIRSTAYLLDIENILSAFTECLVKNGYDMSTFLISDISDKTAGELYEYFLHDKKFSPRTFNKYTGVLTTFLKWYDDEISPVKNWFEKIKRKKTQYNPETITSDEFEALLNVLTPENGIKEYENDTKPSRSLYRYYLKNAFRLALETGRRREEIISLKYSDIINDKSGISYIRVEDFKVNRIQGRIEESEKKYIYIPITASLKALLIELGYEQYKESDNFLLAPEITGSNRTKQISEVVSRAFTHYFHLVNPNKKLNFKSLRKTYISNLSLMLGDNTKSITGHSGSNVINEHYFDRKLLMEVARDFEVFPHKTIRETQLELLRNENTNHQNKEKGIER